MGGRGGSSGLTARNTPKAQTIPLQAQPQPQPQPLQQQPPQPQPQQPANPQPDSQGFNDTDSRPFHDLRGGRAYYQQQQFDVDARTALSDYLDPNTTPGSLYNASQNMNYAAAHGTMDAQQQYMYDSINGAMHNLGENLNLTRYDHGGALDQMIKDITGQNMSHTGLSISALKQMLVGGTYSDNRILSTSYNDFRNSQNPQTFTTREVKITYQAKASTQALMPGIGSIPLMGSGMSRGDNFGEMLLGPTMNGHNSYKVVDVRLSGNKARAKGGSTSRLNLDQIEVVVEVG